MAFLIVCRDGDDMAVLRSKHLPAHRDYVDLHEARLMLSGPLMDDESERRIGQVFVLDVPDRASAETFVQQDPFTRAEIFANITIDQLDLRFQQGSRLAGTR